MVWGAAIWGGCSWGWGHTDVDISDAAPSARPSTSNRQTGSRPSGTATPRTTGQSNSTFGGSRNTSLDRASSARGSSSRGRFDVDAGREEILNRRVGRNELSTLETLRALVEAQRQSTGGAPGPYAKRVLSSEGQRNGLYWPVEESEPESPLGPFVAEAFEEGYRADGPIPYHGYYYRLLTGQGPSAPGGARSYLDEQGALRGGFGVIAWPAT